MVVSMKLLNCKSQNGSQYGRLDYVRNDGTVDVTFPDLVYSSESNKDKQVKRTLHAGDISIGDSREVDLMTPAR